MRKLERPGILASMLVLALGVTSGCTPGGQPSGDVTASAPRVAPTTSGRPVGPDALVSLAGQSAYEVPTGDQDVIADGSLVFRNVSGTPIRVKRVEPVLGSGGSGLKVVGIKVLPLRTPADEPVGIQRQFPPSDAVAERWRDAVGATIEPEKNVSAYEFVIGFSVDAGTHHIAGIRVEFEADGAAFQTDLSHDLTLCRMADPSTTTC